MIETILPAGVRSAEAFDDRAPAPLFPEEAALVAGADPKRRTEFATARACARRALGELGLPPVPVLRDASRAPRWPHGVVGSLTHCAGYRAAAVARADAFAAVGIDAEPHAPLPDGVLGLVAGPVERAELARLGRADGSVCWDRLLFCGKEAAYKAWYPLTRRWLGFGDAVVTIDPAGTFTAEILAATAGTAPGPARFAGRWLARNGLLLAAVTASNRREHGPDGHRGPE
ncbi:4'-phosphopantetheinyl transferase [Dactylosporangium sp. NPDC048998]|uniref:4'-phosphopantetheinyl transferase family protein n=1 Tax=Dactylosporangium sp. NPDC048998 TaxID=3363976 RepID=UPI0037207931